MFDTISTLPPPPPPPPRKPKVSRGKRMVFFFITTIIGGISTIAFWLADHRKEWVIERTHLEFGTRWYYSGNNHTPFDSPQFAVRLRRKRAERFAEILKGTYPNHSFQVLNIKTVEENA